jgi:hypothetical protein
MHHRYYESSPSSNDLQVANSRVSFLSAPFKLQAPDSASIARDHNSRSACQIGFVILVLLVPLGPFLHIRGFPGLQSRRIRFRGSLRFRRAARRAVPAASSADPENFRFAESSKTRRVFSDSPRDTRNSPASPHHSSSARN